MSKKAKQLAVFLPVVALLYLLLFCITAKASVYFMQNENHLRISFDIDKLSDYNIENKDKSLKLSFNFPIENRFNEIKEKYPNLFADYTISDDKKNISLKLHQNTDISSYREGNTLILDISIPEKDKTPAVINNKKLKTAKLTYNNSDGHSKFSFEFDQLPPYEIKKSGEKTLLIIKKPYQFQTDTLSDYPLRQGISFKEEAPGQYVFTIPEPLYRSFENASHINIETGKKTDPRTEIISEQAVHQAPVKVRSLSFSWNQPVNIAVFKRNKYLWIVFDRHQTLEIDELTKEAAPLASELYQLPEPKSTILRLTPEENINAAVRKEGLLWIVDLYSGPETPREKKIPVFTRYDTLNRAYLFAQTENAGTPVSVFDPDIGDVMSIIPVNNAGYGTVGSYSYPDIDFLETVNGLAMIYKADDININTTNTGVTIRRDNDDLNISYELNDLKRQNFLYGDSSVNKQFIMNIPEEILNKPFIEAVEALEQDIIKTDPANTNRIKMRLAGYYLTKGLGTNALKILNTIEKEKAPESQSDLFHGMRGVANFLTRRYEEAIRDFSYGSLEEHEETRFWKALAATALTPRAEDNDILSGYAHLLKSYPDEIRRRIALTSIEAALLVNDDSAVQDYIDIIRDSSSPIDQKPAVSYYNARKLELMGYPLNAVREYRLAANSPSEYYSALSRRRMTDIRLRTNAITPQTAAEEYEKLRYAWGTPEFKLDILKQLAAAYIQAKEYYKALKTLEEARKQVDKEEAEQLTGQMIRIFDDLYYNNHDDNIPTLKSLALYQDFNWIAPLSRHYNAIVQKLADRLVAVDLLPRAYTLLSTQLREGKLSPQEIGTIGTRMALINLFNNEPQAALEILDKTENDRLTPTIIAHRRIIRARALSGVGRSNEAMELLENDFSRNGILVKSEIFWNNGMWGDAANSIKYLIEKPQQGKPLSPEQIQLVLEWATALKKAGNETVIVRLKNTFEPYFKETPYISMFNVLTDTMEADKIDMKNIDETLNNIADFGNFARIYADSLQKSSLSETIK